GEERAHAAFGDGIQNRHQRRVGISSREHALVLDETPRTIEPVPVADAIQWIEEWLVMLDGVALQRSMEPDPIEGLQSHAADQWSGWRERHAQRRSRTYRTIAGAGGDVRPGEDAAATLPVGRQAVDPSHAVVERR